MNSWLLCYLCEHDTPALSAFKEYVLRVFANTESGIGHCGVVKLPPTYVSTDVALPIDPYDPRNPQASRGLCPHVPLDAAGRNVVAVGMWFGVQTRPLLEQLTRRCNNVLSHLMAFVVGPNALQPGAPVLERLALARLLPASAILFAVDVSGGATWGARREALDGLLGRAGWSRRRRASVQAVPCDCVSGWNVMGLREHESALRPSGARSYEGPSVVSRMVLMGEAFREHMWRGGRVQEGDRECPVVGDQECPVVGDQECPVVGVMHDVYCIEGIGMVGVGSLLRGRLVCEARIWVPRWSAVVTVMAIQGHPGSAEPGEHFAFKLRAEREGAVVPRGPGLVQQGHGGCGYTSPFWAQELGRVWWPEVGSVLVEALVEGEQGWRDAADWKLHVCAHVVSPCATVAHTRHREAVADGVEVVLVEVAGHIPMHVLTGWQSSWGGSWTHVGMLSDNGCCAVGRVVMVLDPRSVDRASVSWMCVWKRCKGASEGPVEHGLIAQLPKGIAWHVVTQLRRLWHSGRGDAAHVDHIAATARPSEEAGARASSSMGTHATPSRE